jgi:hypothetical protein
MPQSTSLTDINDVRNGLLLYKPVEWAFDRAKICVEVTSDAEMTFCLLDPALNDVRLVDKACSLRGDAGRGGKPLEKENNLHITFGMLHGRPLQFPDGAMARPSKRLLALHAIAAQLSARKLNPHLDMPNVKFDTSGDETTLRANNTLRIAEWQAAMADVENSFAVSLHHQLLDIAF